MKYNKDLLKYRVITVLPAVYRAWSRMRYNHYADWAAQWADEAQYSACKGRGAQEAWWTTSIGMEQDRAEGASMAVAFFDMAKCYDMIPRRLAYTVLQKLGVPGRVLEGWRNYLKGPHLLQHDRLNGLPAALQGQVPATG